MNNDLISICIPTYNGEKHISQCLESCIEQTYSNYEIIICDDGSTDNTLNIINDFISKSSKIKLFKNEKNTGLVANWNNCIKKSNGKWIKFVFHDDYITKDCLQEFAAHIQDDTRLIVSKRNFIFDYEPDNEEKQHLANKSVTLENVITNTQNKISAKQLSKLAIKNICVNFLAEPSLTFFKKEMVNEIGYFDTSFLQICDLEFFQRVAFNYGLTYLPVKNCVFRLHRQSATSSNISKKLYILFYIEPLLLVHKMLYDSGYKLFRSNLNGFNKLKLILFINTRQIEAQKNALEKSENKTDFDMYCDLHPWLNQKIKNRWFYQLILNFVILKRKIKR